MKTRYSNIIVTDTPEGSKKAIIKSCFDDNLQIEVSNQQRRLSAEHPVYLWRLLKWQFNPNKGTRSVFRFYTLRDLFLVEDLIEEAKQRLKFLYKPLFERSAKLIAKGRMQEYIRLAPYLWSASINTSDSSDDEDLPWNSHSSQSDNEEPL